MNIFEELNWPQFQQLNHIKPLPLNEQVQHYNSYLYELTRNRYLYEQWLANQNKGPAPKQIKSIGLLAQEEFDSVSQDFFFILQENGLGIEVTALV